MTYSAFWGIKHKRMSFMSAAGPRGPFILGLGWHPNEQKHRGPAVHCSPIIGILHRFCGVLLLIKDKNQWDFSYSQQRNIGIFGGNDH